MKLKTANQDPKTQTKIFENCDQCPSRQESVLCSHRDASTIIEKSKLTCLYEKDEIIFHQGQTPVGLYSLQSGLVKVETITERGMAHTHRLAGPGDILGYRSLFTDEKYHASAIALQKTVACFIPKNEAMSIFSKYPELAFRLLNQLGQDLRKAEARWMGQVDRAAQSRIAEALLFLTESFESNQWTRKEIAQWTGTTPETVIRTLADFEAKGLISQKGRKISVLNKPHLQGLSYGK